MELLNGLGGGNKDSKKQDFLQIFSGLIERKLYCKSCGCQTAKFTDQLPTLDVNLLNYSNELNISNIFYETVVKYKCDKCRAFRLHTCKARLKQAPEVLIIRLNSTSSDVNVKPTKSGLIKRFVFDFEEECLPKENVKYIFHCGVFVYLEDNESMIRTTDKINRFADYISINEENYWCVNMKNFHYYPKILFYIKEKTTK